jgi:ABC-type polysaccharide/polyol phosphate export permease
MDLRARYRGSLLGMGWSLLQPVLMTIILCIVFRTIFQQDLTFFAPFLFVGLTLWHFIIAASQQGCHCFFQGEAYIRQYPAPMAIYPLRTMLGAAFHFGISMCLVLILGMWCQGGIPLLALLSLVPSIFLIIVAGWSLSVLFGLANVRFRDTAHLSEVGFQVLFYATPIIYPPNVLNGRRLGLVMDYNPLMPFLKLLREPILYGQVPGITVYASAVGLVLLLSLTALAALRHEEQEIIFNL